MCSIILRKLENDGEDHAMDWMEEEALAQC